MGHSAGHDIDPTFYRSPAEAISAPPEQLAYVVAFDRAAQQPDALAVLDTDPASAGYGQDNRLVVDVVVPVLDAIHHASRVRRIPLAPCAH